MNKKLPSECCGALDGIDAGIGIPTHTEIIAMNVEEQIMELREKQAYWKGVVQGVIASAVFFSGLIALVYYMVQIAQVLK